MSQGKYHPGKWRVFQAYEVIFLRIGRQEFSRKSRVVSELSYV